MKIKAIILTLALTACGEKQEGCIQDKTHNQLKSGDTVHLRSNGAKVQVITNMDNWRYTCIASDGTKIERDYAYLVKTQDGVKFEAYEWELTIAQ